MPTRVSVTASRLRSRGSHRIEEALYREVGVYNGPTIKPIELRVGFNEHMTSVRTSERADPAF
jgi:hypothetical protein